MFIRETMTRRTADKTYRSVRPVESVRAAGTPYAQDRRIRRVRTS